MFWHHKMCVRIEVQTTIYRVKETNVKTVSMSVDLI